MLAFLTTQDTQLILKRYHLIAFESYIVQLFIAFEDIAYDNYTLTLVPDERDTRIHPGLKVTGFTPTEPIARCYNSDQATWYGDPLLVGLTEEEANELDPDSVKITYSRCEMGITVRRALVFFVMRVLPPALITLAVSTLILFLDPMKLDARLSTGKFLCMDDNLPYS